MKNDRDRYKIRYLCYLGLCLIILLGMTSYKQVYAKEEEKNVLIINSYNESFQSTPYKIEGIKNVLQINNINFDIEYMDAKKFDTKEYQELFYELIKYKLDHYIAYDAIMVSDDNALQFAMDYGIDLFGDLPLVFLAINDLERAADAAELYHITGVAENLSIMENIELGLILNKEAKNVYAIVDQTLTGIGDRKQFLSAEEEFMDLNFQVIDASLHTVEELKVKFQNISDDSIVLFLSMNRDKTGRNITIKESTKLLLENVSVPIIRAQVGGIGEGIIGGKMINYFKIGEAAAEMVVSVLNGIPIETLKANYDSNTIYTFDNVVLEKYKIDLNLLPEDSILINQKVSMYEQYKVEVWRFVAVIAFLIFLLVIAILVIWKHRIMLNRLKEQDEFIEHMANYDELTELPNKSLFFDKLRKEIELGHGGVVILLDIDNFKSVNDTLGHTYGNNLLKEIAFQLSNIDDKKLMISRYGGDEFLILICDVDNIDVIETYIQRIKSVFKEALIVDNRENFIRVSIGITRFPEDSNDPNQLLINADTSMYKVKHSGKNNHIFYNNIMLEEVRSKMELEAILREALQTEGFHLVYQPQVNTISGEIIEFEGLLRLKNHNISPGIFIPVAEESGLIIEIGRWVIKEAIMQLANWKKREFPLKPIAINFSNKQLQDDELGSYIEELLNEYEVDPKYLEIEITESILLEKTERALLFLTTMKKLGVSLALDDFGSGFSSINYLTFIPVYKIKLDKSLCDRFLEKENDEVIIKLISLIHSLGLEITAEGIEKKDQYISLKNSGCDYIQGYLFSRPIQVDEIEKIYRDNLLNRIDYESKGEY